MGRRQHDSYRQLYVTGFHRFILIFLLSINCIEAGHADDKKPEHFDLPLNDDTAISIVKFGDHGDRVLWIHSEYGINKIKHYQLSSSLAGFQHEVWLAEIHESYFIPAGRSSYSEIPVTDIAELIEKSIPEGKRKLFIVSTGRGAVLSLLAINRWQADTGGSDNFGGIIMIHPSFQADTPTPGTAMQYLPIVDSVQLPVFIIQPMKSNKYWYLDELVTRLTDSGSQVYIKVIEQASDGYHVRPETSEAEDIMAKKLPGQISSAMQVLAKTTVTPRKQNAPVEDWQVSSIAESLQPYPDNIKAPDLALLDMQDNEHRLEDYLGRVVVLNFWATWCPPCVEEIPSLNRLQQAFPDDDLVVLSVDIGEQMEEVETFLQRVPADFPVLLNPGGSTVKQWKIIAFPTTFIIDKQGIIKLAYFGGLEWDKPSVVKQLQKLTQY
jgi:thiol-disulfide isomerase/thioredoxin